MSSRWSETFLDCSVVGSIDGSLRDSSLLTDACDVSMVVDSAAFPMLAIFQMSRAKTTYRSMWLWIPLGTVGVARIIAT